MFFLHLLTYPVSPRLDLGRALHLFSHSVELFLCDQLVISCLLSLCHHLRVYFPVDFNLWRPHFLGQSGLTLNTAFIIAKLFFDLFSHLLDEFDAVLVPLEEFSVTVGWVLFQLFRNVKNSILLAYLTIKLHRSLLYGLLNIFTRLSQKRIVVFIFLNHLRSSVLTDVIIGEVLMLSTIYWVLTWLAAGLLLGLLEFLF